MADPPRAHITTHASKMTAAGRRDHWRDLAFDWLDCDYSPRLRGLDAVGSWQRGKRAGTVSTDRIPRVDCHRDPDQDETQQPWPVKRLAEYQHGQKKLE